MRKLYKTRYKTYEEAMKEADLSLLSMDQHRKTGDIEKDSILYRRQQTEEGQRILSSIDKMASSYSKILGKHFKTGRLIPLYDSRTGELIRYIET